jgi:thiol-disulfide isomerase/thioredoxin
MVTYLCFLLFFGWTPTPGSSGSPGDARALTPPVWHLNMREAREIARKEHRYILLNFSGSDWCGPCIMLRKGIFDDPVFAGFADSALVLVNADFPRMKKNQLAKEQQRLNDQLADEYNSQGKFPLTLLLDMDGKVVREWEGNPSVRAEVFDAQVRAAIGTGRVH